jgi:hypothetical protein
MSGQGRVAVGAIAGASVVALVCIGFTGGLAPGPTQSSAVPGDVPVVMTADPGTSTTQNIYPVSISTTGSVPLTTTISATTTTTTALTTTTTAPSVTHSSAPVTTTQPVVTTTTATHTHPKPPPSTTTTTCGLLFC